MIKFEVWKWNLKSLPDPETNNCTPFQDFTIFQSSHFPELCQILWGEKYQENKKKIRA